MKKLHCVVVYLEPTVRALKVKCGKYAAHVTCANVQENVQAALPDKSLIYQCVGLLAGWHTTIGTNVIKFQKKSPALYVRFVQRLMAHGIVLVFLANLLFWHNVR